MFKSWCQKSSRFIPFCARKWHGKTHLGTCGDKKPKQSWEKCCTKPQGAPTRTLGADLVFVIFCTQRFFFSDFSLHKFRTKTGINFDKTPKFVQILYRNLKFLHTTDFSPWILSVISVTNMRSEPGSPLLPSRHYEDWSGQWGTFYTSYSWPWLRSLVIKT